MGQKGPYLLRALEVLADGEWHPYKEVVSKVAAVVPPGVASRRAEHNRAHRARRAGYATVEQRRVAIDTVQLARVGALSIARQTIIGSKHLFEIDPPSDFRRVERRIRLRVENGDT